MKRAAPSPKTVSAIFALIAVLGAYLLAVPLDEGMAAPLLKVVPRISRNVQSFVPAFLRPLAFTSNTSTFSSSQTSSFTTITTNMTHDTLTFKDAIQNRRTIYQLTKKSTISDDRIKEILTTAIKDVPSSFNSQSARLVVLLKDEHDKFWEVVTNILKAHVPEANWEHTAQRMDMFKSAYGSILFYEAPEPIRQLQSKFAQYADKFPQWSEHTSAMHQYMLWTALEAEGLGCNLQHYNPLPNQKVSEIWGVPLEWDLKAQLVFGTPEEGAREKLPEKAMQPVEERLFIHGA